MVRLSYAKFLKDLEKSKDKEKSSGKQKTGAREVETVVETGLTVTSSVRKESTAEIDVSSELLENPSFPSAAGPKEIQEKIGETPEINQQKKISAVSDLSKQPSAVVIPRVEDSDLQALRISRPSNEDIESGQHQLVCFQLGGEEYAIDIIDVQEIYAAKNIRPLPNQQFYILGITKVREKTVPVIDLARRMGLKIPVTTKYPYLMIVTIKNEMIGLAVENVTEVRLLEKEVLEAPPILPKSGESDYFDGIYVIDGKLLIVLQVEKILTSSEIADLAQALTEVRSNFSGDE